MLRGMYTASRGMVVQMECHDVIANNIANVNTSGYKRDVATAEPFRDVLLHKMDKNMEGSPIGVLGFGSRVGPRYTDFAQGYLQPTGNPLDVSIDGRGFFAIETDDGIKYTRSGVFTLNDEGQLITMNGNPVMGVNGPIQVPHGEIVISEDRDLLVNGQYVDSILVYAFEDESVLVKEGDNLYSAVEGQGGQLANDAILRQGFVENSNVNVVNEMIEMISATRNYEACQKVLQSYDMSLDKCVNEIARI